MEIFELDWGGRKLKIETGKLAGLANGAVKVQYGDTVVLATAVISKERKEEVDYFPLVVDYKENLYAAGKISGSRFIKREGRPTDEAILTGRLVDRAIRPLFDQSIRHEIQIVLNVLSIDEENDPDAPSLIAAALALMISDIPWKGPLSGCTVGFDNDKFILNPNFTQKEESQFNFLIAGRGEEVVMLEGGAKEVKEEKINEAVVFALANLKAVNTLLETIQKKVGKQKQEIKAGVTQNEELRKKIEEFTLQGLDKIFGITSKEERRKKETELKNKIKEIVSEEENSSALEIFEEVMEREFRRLVLEKGKRIDGRNLDEIRPLSMELGILPRTHGSALFQRGETQILSTITLGAPGQVQVLDGMEISGEKRFMHHYNFPGFSVGEVSPLRGPGRREIGHGALAEKALQPLVPGKEKFPYTIRIVSEVFSSNGSSSQASICASSLALMDAGVPFPKHIAGIAMGLVISEDKKNYRILTDIQGIEDHAGDMDFKIAGTAEGITAMQLDIKLGGIGLAIIKEALAGAKKARESILAEMKQIISSPRPELSPHAPRVVIMTIDPEKIRDLIGPQGKVINEIIEATGVTIDIEQDGTVYVTSEDAEKMQEALAKIKAITKEVAVGDVYDGVVTQIIKDRNADGKEIGAIVELTPAADGMVHISQVAHHRIAKVSDILKIGERVKVKVIGIDKDRGRIELSRKALIKNQDG